MDFSQVDWKVLLIALHPVIMYGLNWVQDHMGEWKMPRVFKWALSFFIAQALAWLGGLDPVTATGVASVGILSYSDGRRKQV